MLKGFVAMAHPLRVTNAQSLEIATCSPRDFAACVADAPSWSLARIPRITPGMRKLVRRFLCGHRYVLLILPNPCGKYASHLGPSQQLLTCCEAPEPMLL